MTHFTLNDSCYIQIFQHKIDIYLNDKLWESTYDLRYIMQFNQHYNISKKLTNKIFKIFVSGFSKLLKLEFVHDKDKREFARDYGMLHLDYDGSRYYSLTDEQMKIALDMFNKKRG